MKGSKLKSTRQKDDAAMQTKKQLKKKAATNTKLYSSPPKMQFRDPIGHTLPASLQNFRWNVDKVERKLQEKIQEKTQIAGNFVYQQAYRLLECTRGEGIDFPSFKEQLRIKFGIILDDNELQLLFNKYDEDQNGTIDLNEFIRRVLPPDYNYGQQWFEVSQQESEEKQARLKRESRNEFLTGMGRHVEELDNMGEISNWTLETLMKQIQLKVVQKTPSGDDQYRRAFKMLRSGRDQGIRVAELRNNLKTKFGIFISEAQMRDLFSQFDVDGSGDINLKEFLQFVEPKAYTGDSKVPNGLWTKSPDDDDEEEEDEGSTNSDGDEGNDLTLVGRNRMSQGSISSSSSCYGGNANGRKERPKSANPKKSAMLQQRRQIAEQRKFAAQNSQHGQHHLQRQRLSMSLADIHNDELNALTSSGATNHPHQNAHRCQHLRPDQFDECESSTGSYSTAFAHGNEKLLRPRSAGSVRSSSRMSSTASTVTSSVRGAAYMKRPTIAQNLRQKCFESRNTMAAEHFDGARSKRRVSAGSTEKTEVAMQREQHNGTHSKPLKAGERRRSCSDMSGIYNGKSLRTHSPKKNGKQLTFNDENEAIRHESMDYQPPRVVKVHPKQHDDRPFSKGNQVLRRSNVISSGYR